MLNDNTIVFNDTRENLRVNERKSIQWHIKESALRGQGRIHNISTSGMLLETNSNFKPYDQCVFSFDTTLNHNNYIPQYGRLVWFKKKNFSGNRYLCGIKFVEPAEYVLTKLRQRVQRGLNSLTNLRRAHYVMSVLLFAGLVSLIGFILWQSGLIYQNLTVSLQKMLSVSGSQSSLTREFSYRYEQSQLQLINVTQELESTKKLYQESEAMLNSVNKELQSTKKILAQTEALLAQAQINTTNLSADLQSLQNANTQDALAKRQELENTVALLQEQNVQLKNEMTQLQQKLSEYSIDIKNTQEGKLLIKKFKGNIKDIKEKIGYFKAQAREVRIAARLEKDRIRSLIGNNGFFIKNGKRVEVDEEKYNAAVLDPAATSVAPSSSGSVEIDVTFYE
ncbi:MAG: PilZ domain-containing protein [Candidatus Omnitrophica bacterium]|nr:PilZ domain-containing protein [Candidatus Omnitrophota bacterium]